MLHCILRFAAVAWCLGLAACGTPAEQGQEAAAPADSTAHTAPTAQLEAELHLTDPELKAFAERFPLARLPLLTERDSLLPPTENLGDKALLKRFVLPNSPLRQAADVRPYTRLPYAGNYVALVLATLQQESGGLVLVLLTCTPEGKPIDELALKEDADAGGFTSFFTNSKVYSSGRIEVNRTELRMEGEGEDFKEKERRTYTKQYAIEASGNIKEIQQTK